MECPTCSSQKTQRRGFEVLKKKVKQRFQCQDCSHWFTGNYIGKGDL
jgi:transposase-like protein